MLKFTAVAALLCCSLAVVLAKECGTRPARSGKIVNGKDAYENQYPWQVSWRYLNTTTNVHRHICGASLISPTWVVTAAHCVDINQDMNINKDLFKALVGGHSQSNPSVNQRVIEVKQIIVHPTWDSASISGDFALVELQEPVDIENGPLNAICIGDFADNLEGQNVEISGWGLNQTGATAIPDILQWAIVPVVKQSTCKTLYSFITKITEAQVCAGYDPGVCNGDSGGPLQYQKNGKYYLLGATSFGVGCANKNFPAVFSRVPFYADYITEKTGVAKH